VLLNGAREYRLETRPRILADFEPTCWWHRTSPKSHFTRSLVCSRLTDTGRAFLERCRRIIIERDEAIALIDERGEPQGELRITCSTAMGERFIAPLVRGFAGRHPKLSVTIELTNGIIDLVGEGFAWAVVDDKANAVFAWTRHAPAANPVLIIANMTPVPRPGYRVPVPRDGSWREIINSDAQHYGGSGVGNFGAVEAADGHAILTLPPLATIMLEHGH